MHSGGQLKIGSFLSILFCTLFACAFLVAGQASAAENVDRQAQAALADLQVPFVQSGDNYRARLSNGFVQAEEGGLRYILQDEDGGFQLVEEFNGDTDAVLKSGKQAPTKVSRFIGDDAKKWETGLDSYHSVIYENAFAGVDARVEVKRGTVEKIYDVAPGVSPDNISMTVRGASTISVNERGDLVLRNGEREVSMTAPVAYQVIDGERHDVEVEYALRGGERYGFDLGEYDTSHELVIDPILDATYLGGGSTDVGSGVVVAPDDSVYVSGHTASTSLATTGAYDETEDTQDFFVAKFSSDLTTLEAATYVGGGSADREADLALADNGDVVVFGRTFSSDFPTHGSTADATSNGGYDLAIARLSGDLTSFVGGTYYGGSGTDYPEEVAIDSNGNIFVVGWGFSSNMPTTGGAYDTSAGSGIDTYIGKFDSGLDNLTASTYLGYNSSDYGMGLLLDDSDNLYVFGRTFSSNFPTTAGAYDQTYSFRDGYVAHLSNDLTSLQASTFLSGFTSDEITRGVIADNGDLYVIGYANSSNYPTTGGAYQTSKAGNSDVVISRLTADLTTLVASTFLGGSDDEEFGVGTGFGIAADSDNNIYAFGGTDSNDFPTASAEDGTLGGNSDMFFSVLNEDLSTLVESTYVGGSNDESTNNMTMDNNGDLLLVGYTFSNDFPTTTGAYDETHGGSGDFAIVRMEGQLSSSGSNNNTGGGTNFDQIVDANITAENIPTCESPLRVEVTIESGNVTEYRMTDSVHYADFGSWKDLPDDGQVDFTLQEPHEPGEERTLFVQVQSGQGFEQTYEKRVTMEGVECDEDEGEETGKDVPDESESEDEAKESETDSNFGKPVLPDNVDVDDLLKTEDDSAVYYIGDDHKRHAFPNKSVFDSWGFSFDDVKIVPDHTVAFLVLGPNMTYKPGITPVTFRSTNKVYAVDEHGVLRHINGPSVARALYGEGWKDKVRDISVVFFNDYIVGKETIDSSDEYSPEKLKSAVVRPTFTGRE
jgi:hypothetical protein